MFGCCLQFSAPNRKLKSTPPHFVKGLSMKRNDPKILKLKTERDRAAEWLNILRIGLGHALADGYQQEPETLRLLVDRINKDLVAAICEVETTQKAYEPYLPWRRRRIVRPRRRAKKP